MLAFQSEESSWCCKEHVRPVRAARVGVAKNTSGLSRRRELVLQRTRQACQGGASWCCKEHVRPVRAARVGVAKNTSGLSGRRELVLQKTRQACQGAKFEALSTVQGAGYYATQQQCVLNIFMLVALFNLIISLCDWLW